MKKLALITLILLAFLSTLISCKKQDLNATTTTQNTKHYFYVAEVSNTNDTTKTEIIVVQ